MQAITSALVGLRPPDQLVLEVRATGRYSAIRWTRGSSGSIPTNVSYIHFGEVLYKEITSSEDFGEYRASLIPHEGQNNVEAITFRVTEAGVCRFF